jgi:enamine deaminase RidA (YjgF/YER057c/UK114 family)
MKAPVSSDKIPAPAGPYSPGVTVGEWIFLSGQGGFDSNTGASTSQLHRLPEPIDLVGPSVKAVCAPAFCLSARTQH